MTPPTITQAHPPIDLDDLVAKIRRFGALPLPEQHAFIEELVEAHPKLSLQWGPGWSFRRARALHQNEIPKKVDDVIWPNEIAAKIGRANPKGFPVMYLADRRDTALRETGVEQGWAVVADFEIRPQHAIHICPIGELFQIVRTGRGPLAGEASTELSKMINACPPRDARSLIISDAFLYAQMVEHDNYELSSCVAAEIFKRMEHVSAIAYKSRRQLGALNIAVKAHGFWRDWGIRSVTHGFADHLVLGFYKLSQIRAVTGIHKSGEFQWQKDTTDEEGRVLLEPLYLPTL